MLSALLNLDWFFAMVKFLYPPQLLLELEVLLALVEGLVGA